MTVFGYARKDYPGPILKQLTTLMTYDCDQVFVENQSFDEETELQQLLNDIQEGDSLVVASLAVFGRRLKGLTALLTLLDNQNIRLISVGEELDSLSDYSVYALAQVLYQTDAECQSQYTKERLAVSKSLGKSLGRPTISQETIDRIVDLHLQHKLNYREISEQCGVSLGSVHKYIQNEVVKS